MQIYFISYKAGLLLVTTQWCLWETNNYNIILDYFKLTFKQGQWSTQHRPFGQGDTVFSFYLNYIYISLTMN